MIVDDTDVDTSRNPFFEKYYRITILNEHTIAINGLSTFPANPIQFFFGEKRYRTTVPPGIPASYRPTHRTVDNLRLRDKVDTSSFMATTLPKDMEVEVVETGPSATINGMNAHWVKVVSSSGYTGWCFSGYLEALPMAASAPENPATTQETPEPAAASAELAAVENAGAERSIPVVFIALGGGLVLLAAGAVFFVLRRKG